MPEPATPDVDADAPKKRKPPIALAIGALAVCAGAGSLVYFVVPQSLLPSAGEAHAPGTVDARPDKKPVKAEAKPAGKAHSSSGQTDASGDSAAKFSLVGDYGVYAPEPIVVSIRATGRVRYLKLGYAIETDADSEARFLESELRIKDALNLYLRSVDVASLEDPAVMNRIRAQIGRRVAVIVEPAPVRAVLITDFILS